jgi:hypothetical protein
MSMKAKMTSKLFFAAAVAVAGMTVATGAAHAASTGTNDKGTSLSVLVDDPVVTCAAGGGSATVDITYSVASTAAADAASITLQIIGDASSIDAAAIASGCVADGGDWTCNGRTKTADRSYSTTLANGTYTIQICATQNGSGGRLPKTACSQIKNITVDCPVELPAPACPSSYFGEFSGNTNLCNGSPIQVNFTGDFGETATLNITGPDYSDTISVDRDGDSCNYHASWDANGPGKPVAIHGEYTFTVNGTTVTKTLDCD